MYDAFGIYYEPDEVSSLVAAGRWTSGGNSAAARRARVAMQRRDRYGRWAEMGGGISFPGRNSDNKIVKMVGRYVGPAEREGYMRVYVTQGRGIRPGVYEVPSKVATVAKALLSEESLKDVGVNLDVNGFRVGEVLDRDIEFLEQMWKGEPSEFELDMARSNLSNREKKVIEKARLKAPAHKSYNIVDENGNRVDKDEEEPAKKPAAKAKKPVYPIPDVSNVIGANGKKIKRELLEWYVDKNGIRIPESKLKESDKTPENRRIRDLENHRVLDGNGNEVEFNPKYSPDADPRPAERPSQEDGFWDSNDVSPEEVQKGITDAQEAYEALYDGGFIEVDEDVAIEALKIAMEDRKFIGPDDNPIGASKLARELSSALESLPQAQVNRLRRSINPAALNEERAKALLEFIQSKDGQPLTADEMKMLHRKYRNLGVDLTNMKIEGENSYLNNNLGAERGRMPQLSTPEDQADFEAALDKLGIKHTPATFTPDQLTPVQAEMDMGNVGKIMKSWLDPELRAKYNMDNEVLYVTRDGYVIDGHHRWASALLAQKESGKPINLKCVVVDLDHEDALRICNEYNDHIGVTRQTLGATGADAEPTPKRAVPGEVGRKATLPKEQNLEDLLNLPARDRVPAMAGQNRPERDENGGPSLREWFETRLADKGDEILSLFNDKLTEDKPSTDPDDIPYNVMLPGSRTLVKGLLKTRDNLKTALLEAALDGDQEAFAYRFSLAERVAKFLNQIHSNLSNDLDFKTDTELAGSTDNPELRLAQMRIMENTVRTSIDNRGRQKIEKMSAVYIAKNGEPFIIEYNGGSTFASFKVDSNGRKAGPAGTLSIHSMQSLTTRPDGTYVVTPAYVSTAFQTEDRNTKALGLMTQCVLMARWIQHQYGGVLTHSSNLYPPGNFYSKKVSRNMRWNDRTQADKAVQNNCPDAEIFKVLKSMGLVDGEFIPYDPNARDSQPAGNGTRSGGSGWLKRLTIANSTGSGANQSVLWQYTETTRSVANQAYEKFKQLSQQEKADVIPTIPEVFRKYFTEKGNPIDDFDIQFKLLETAYKDGMTKEESVAFLKTIEDAIPVMESVFGLQRPTNLGPIRRLREAIEAHNWNQDNNRYTQPVFNANWLRNFESPFSGKFKFDGWKVPKGTSRIFNTLPFASGAKPAGAPDNWNDNPSVLKQNFSAEELLGILRDSILNEQGKIAHIPEKDGAATYDVNPNAVYKALENHGVDAELMLAEVYDEALGTSENVDSITNLRAENGNLNDAIVKMRRGVGELAEPTAFDEIGGAYENEVLKSDLVKRQEENVGGDPALNLRELQPNRPLVYKDSNIRAIDPARYTFAIPNRRFQLQGTTDNPKLIARNFSTAGLKNALYDAIENKRSSVNLEFSNGSRQTVPITAIRDALQHQGVDTHEFLMSHPALKEGPRTPVQLGEVIEEEGDKRRRLNFYSFFENQSADSEHLYENQLKDRASGTLESYELGISQNSTDRNFKVRIAKIQKNADGKYEVWVSGREQGRTEEFSGEPMGVYDNWKNAYYDVSEFIKRDMNLSQGTFRLRNDAAVPTINANREFQAGTLLNDENPGPITLENGITVQRDIPGQVVNVFTPTGVSRRIPGAVDGSDHVSEAYTVATNITAGVNDLLEVARHNYLENNSRGEIEQKSEALYHILNLGDNRYGLILWQGDGEQAITMTFDDVTKARIYAKAFVQSREKIAGRKTANIPGWDNLTNNKTMIAGTPATLGEQTSAETDSAITRSSRITLRGGAQANVTITMKKGAHPAWRRGVSDSENQYEYASVEITDALNPNMSYGKFDITRVGVRQWQVNASPTHPILRTLDGETFNNFIRFADNKENALNTLKSLTKILGLDEEKTNSLFPDTRVVNAPIAAEPEAPAAPSAEGRVVRPIDTPEGFQEFLAERGQQIDVSTYSVLERDLGGSSGAMKIQTPDGKIYKYKDEGEDKARMESFNHSLYRLLGVKITEGRLGYNGSEVVLADSWMENVQNMWPSIFRDANYRNPLYAQAIADIREGFGIDWLVRQWDLKNNGGNAFVVPDENGVLRGIRCDAGSGGLYDAIGNARNSAFGRNAVDFVKDHIGDIMRNGQASGFNDEGGIYRGLTKQMAIDIVRRTVLPLTDDKLAELVRTTIDSSRDKTDLLEGLKRRRRELLEYFQISEDEEVPSAARPVAIGGNLERDGYEFTAVLPNGKSQVRLKGSVRPDGMFVAEDWAGVPAEIKDGIYNGDFVPENLPFISKDVPADGIRRDADGNILDSLPLFVDANGTVRPSPYGMTTLMLRKRMADGTYQYLYVTPGGANGDPTAKRLWSGKYAPLYLPKYGVNDPDPTPQEIMMANLGVSVDPVSVMPVMTRIPGVPGQHKILVADIGDQQLDLNGASDRIGASTWREAERLRTRAGSYWNQFEDNNTIINHLQTLERTAVVSPSNQNQENSADEDAGNGAAGGGPSNPDSPQAGGDSGNRDSDGYRAITVRAVVGRDGQLIANEVVEVGDYADGSLKVKNQTGLVLGRVQPTFHGHWVATYMPNDITGRDGNNRNGDAVKAIFATKEEANHWLSHKIGDFYGTPADRRTDLVGGNAGVARPVAKFEVSKGFLNETTQDQRNFANRLIEQKVATPEERALYRAILFQANLTVGEVGWVIGQLRDNEDRDPAEIEQSRQDMEDALNASPIPQSAMDNAAPIAGQRVVNASNLRVGHKILGNVNARVVFTTDGDNNTVNIGVVGDDGKLRVFKVGRSTVIPVGNQIEAEAPAAQQPVHPVIAQRRADARLVQQQIKDAYPNARELPNGDLIVGHRDRVMADGTVFRFEAIVHKLKSDEFVSYVRRQQIDANGNPIGSGDAAYFTTPGHSPKAVIGRLRRSVLSVLNRRDPVNGYNQREDISTEGINPATGLPLPRRLMDEDAQFIGDTGIEKTGNAVKDALISYIQGLVARGVAQPDIISRVIGGNQRLFTENQMNDIIERLEWNRQFPGVNAIPYVSKDNKTIVRVGDKVTHYDAFGNPILMANGQPRTGVVTARRPYTLNRKPNGDYEYTDQLYVQWADTRRPHQAAARRLEVNQRADGSAPVPAVQSRQPSNAPAPSIEELPNQQVPNVEANQAEDIFENTTRFSNAEIDIVRGLPNFPADHEAVSDGEGGIFVRPVGGGMNVGRIVPSNGVGPYIAYTGGQNENRVWNGEITRTDHETKLEAVNAMLDRINAANPAPQNAEPADPLEGLNPDGDTFEVGNGSYRIERGINMTRFYNPQERMDDIFVWDRDGQWEIHRQNRDGTTTRLGRESSRAVAESLAKQKIRGREQEPQWNFPVDQLPEGMVLEQGERYNFVGMPGLLNMQPPINRRNFLHGTYSRTPGVNGRYIAEFTDPNNGEFGTKLTEYFDNPEDAHAWVVENLNRARVPQQQQEPRPAVDKLIAEWNDGRLPQGFTMARQVQGIVVRTSDGEGVAVVTDVDNPDARQVILFSPDGTFLTTRPQTLSDAIDIAGAHAQDYFAELNEQSEETSSPAVAPRTLGIGERVTDPADVANITAVRQDELGRTLTYLVNRQPENTWFDTADDRRNFIFVGRSPLDGSKWQVKDGRNNRGLVSTHDTREEAEMAALNRIANGAPSEQREYESLTPEQELEQVDILRDIARGEVSRRRQGDGSVQYYYDGDLVGEIDPTADGKFRVYDIFSGDFVDYDTQAEAMTAQEENISRYDAAGMFDRGNDGDGGDSGGPSNPPSDGGGGGTPPPSNPPSDNGGNGANPLGNPEPVVVDGVERDAEGYEIGNPNDAIAKQLGLPPGAEYVPPLTPFGGVQEQGFGYIKTGTGMSTVLTPATEEQARAFGFTGDGTGGAVPNRPRPGDELRPVGPDFMPPQDTIIVPQSPESPTLPPIQPSAPEAPEAEEPQAPQPQGRPRVNTVQPGDRFVKFNAKRSGVPGQGPNYWEVRDRKTGKVIARAQTRDVADEIAAGIRDLNGKPIDFQTPIPPRQAPVKAPRPNGYKRTAVGQGYFLENQNDPNAPVARVEFDRDQNKWVGKLYANKQDAEAQRDPIGSEISDTSQSAIESKANEAVQQELDRRNPPAPAPVEAEPEVQQEQNTGERTNLGSDYFMIHNGANEYGSARLGDDGKWSIEVYGSARDARDGKPPIATGSYDSSDEADAAIRKAIADNRAPQQANILQWQSGSDGKAYLGLDGVPGYDAETSPVWGISQMPFGAGWVMAAWNTKADRDAGLPPAITGNYDSEEEARAGAESGRDGFMQRVPPTQ